MIETLLVAAVTASITAFFTAQAEQRRWKREFEMDQNRIRSEFMAEQVVRQLLEAKDWQMRSFSA